MDYSTRGFLTFACLFARLLALRLVVFPLFPFSLFSLLSGFQFLKISIPLYSAPWPALLLGLLFMYM